MRKRMTSLLLTLVMLLSLVPAMGVTANAAETWETITTYEQFAEAMTANAPRNVRLGADIDTGPLTSGIGLLDTLTVKGQKQLDLNGHTLRLFTKKDALGNLIKVENSSLTLSDSSEAHTGRILGVTSTDSNVLISVWQNGKFTMNGGKLEVEAGEFRDVLWRRTIDCRYGGEVVINGGTLYVPPKTYERYENQLLDQFLDEFDDLRNGSCGYTLIADNECEVTITGGAFQGPVRMNASNSKWNGTTSRVIITGGTFENNVVLNGAGSKAGDGKVTLAEIKGGTFLGKVQAWAAASFDNSFSTPEVVISGGDFIKEFWLRPKFPLVNNKEQRGVAYQVAAKLNGGTFHEGFSADKDSENYEYSASAVKQRLKAYEIYQLADKLLGQNAIQTGNGTFAAQDYNSYNKYITNYRQSEHDSGEYAFIIKAVNNQPTTIIPNAWGMKSVTLDGDPIDYFKNWNGTVENLTNDEAHTLKFEWYPLAQELKDAGYTYRATCEHYISGSTAVQQTDTIAADKTSHTVTIEKGVDPKVYSYDLQLNLQKDGSSVGIYTNDHIVKLVVNQAPVVEPDPTIEGNVYYTSSIVFDRPISIAASVTPTTATPAYQWQRSKDGGSTWKNIEGATSGKYTPVEADMGDTVRIRVKVTAEGYLGEIVGAALKVSKAANNNYPEVIQLEAEQDGAGNYTGFKITNFDPNCEYVYSTTSTPDWNANQITSDTVTDLTSDTTYYVFARFKETATHTAGSIVSRNSIKLFDNVPLQYVLLEGYDSGNTIYIKQGENVTLKVSADPSNANSWSEITFKERGTATGCITVTDAQINASGTTATPFPNGHTITITGVSTGSATLDASYSGYGDSSYGRWNVVVYDDSTVADALRFKNVYTYEDITLSVNDEAELPTKFPKLLPEGSGYKPEWRIVKVGSGAAYSESDENITLENGKIKPIKAHTGSEKTRLELVAVKEGQPIKSFSPPSVFNVTVTEAPTVELTGVTVAPKKVNLANVGATCQLSAVKEPVNAPGELKWESSDDNIATVSNTGKVTAVGKGEATITVSCGDKKATCTVTVDHTHNTNSQTWALLNDNEHFRSCTAGDDTQIEAHKVNSWTANTDGKTHTGTCTECGYAKTENHSWEVVGEVAPTVDTEGSRSYKCSACAATKTESIPKLIEYSVTVQDDGNGTASASPATAVAGTEIKLTATANSGYHFKEWQVVTGSVTINGNKFTMPDGNVEVKAIFEKNTSTGGGGGGGGVTTYAITVKSAKNGDVTASHKTASKGTAVTLTVDPDKGYVLDTLTVLDDKDKEIKLTEKNGKYVFTMPSGKVTVAGRFKVEQPADKHPFTDIPSGAYYENAVIWAADKGITGGTSATTFSPNGICTRAQAVTFLWRAAGSPAPKSMNSFADVPADAYYAKAVAWAVENGITSGTGGGKFSPNAICTRAQIVTFLYRAAGSPAVSGGSVFSDVKAGAYYADAVTWAANKDITGGIGNGLFGSDNNCTRAQIVTFLYRYME